MWRNESVKLANSTWRKQKTRTRTNHALAVLLQNLGVRLNHSKTKRLSAVSRARETIVNLDRPARAARLQTVPARIIHAISPRSENVSANVTSVSRRITHHLRAEEEHPDGESAM